MGAVRPADPRRKAGVHVSDTGEYEGAMVEATVRVCLSVRQIAEAFCKLDDDEQAKFFVCVGGIMKAWGAGRLETQCFNVGRHLVNCACSTHEARDVVNAMANGIEYDNAKSADYRTDPVNQPENIR